MNFIQATVNLYPLHTRLGLPRYQWGIYHKTVSRLGVKQQFVHTSKHWLSFHNVYRRPLQWNTTEIHTAVVPASSMQTLTSGITVFLRVTMATILNVSFTKCATFGRKDHIVLAYTVTLELYWYALQRHSMHPLHPPSTSNNIT